MCVTLLVIRFMADLLRKYRGSVVIIVGRGGATMFTSERQEHCTVSLVSKKNQRNSDDWVCCYAVYIVIERMPIIGR